MPDNDSWREYQKLVLQQLERDDTLIKELDSRIDELEKQLIKLSIKAGFWGALAGAIPVLTAVLIKLFG